MVEALSREPDDAIPPGVTDAVSDARAVSCPTCGAGPGLDCEDGIVHLGRAAIAAVESCKAHHPASRFRKFR